MTTPTFKEILREKEEKPKMGKLRENLTQEEFEDLQESLDIRFVKKME